MSQASAASESTRLKMPVPQRAKILLVDDRPENLVTLEAILEDLGEDLVRASSGREALRQVLNHDFAVILLDVKMPDIDGFETAALIRERERSRHTPILFLTAHRDDEHLFRGYYAGAVDFLFKPLNPEVLRSKVSVFVELAKKNELLRVHAEVLESRNAELERTVAERQKAEEHVRQLNAELERRVAERTEELRRSNDQMREFTYAAAHDLQEPLRTVASYAQLLAARYRGKLDADADEFITFVVEGVQRMHVLLKDLLAYSQTANSDTAIHGQANLTSVLAKVIHSLEVTLRESSAEITHDPLPTVHGDPLQLGQVLQNLISNAVKYRSLESPRIHVAAERCGNEWVCSVKDNGLGIDPQYKELIFGIFKRLHGKQYPGTGIGLALVKRIIERHGGRVWVESEPGQGSQFFFALPAD